MQKLLPYLPLSKPLRGPDAARQFDADAFEQYPALDAYCRPLIEGEFNDAPDALRNALAQPLMKPFRFVVEVTRGTGMFPPRREVLQVQMVRGFDSSIDGTLQGGFLSNGPGGPATPPMSKGEASHLLYAPPAE